jgi:hypothetical protein
MMMTKNDQQLGASFRDPSGFLFTHQNNLYRQINKSYQQDYELLMESGLYKKLVKKYLLVEHKESKQSAPLPETAYKIIQPDNLVFISYPYEWSFSQLKDAALLTLRIQKLALRHGMSLKDSSAYNIQFDLKTGKPVMIDTLSFEAYKENVPWVAYRQYCQHFLAPLALMSLTDIRLGKMLRTYIDGIPLDLAAKLLPGKTKFNFGLMSHIHIHARAQQSYAKQDVGKLSDSRRMSKQNLLALINSLQQSTRKLSWKPGGTEWADYYDETNYSSDARDNKAVLISEFIKIAKPDLVWDMGANTGYFSRIASSEGINTIAFDIDEAAVEKNYLDQKATNEKHILPLVLDMTNPSPAIGWHNNERQNLVQRSNANLTLALALVHHLAISNNVPLEMLAKYFSHLAPSLIIEFVPKSDSQVKRLLSTREDIFPNYTFEGFEAAFAEYFNIKKVEDIEGSERKLYLMVRT